MATSMPELLSARAADRADAVAVICDGQTTTYRQLDTRASQVANALAAEGVAEGDRVAFLSRNSAEFFELLFGAARHNAVFVPLNFRLSTQEVVTIGRDAEPKILVVSSELSTHLNHLRDQIPSVKRFLIVGGPAENNYERWRDRHPAHTPAREHDMQRVALLAYTSGTTGKPKGALLTHENLNAAVRAHAGPYAMSTTSKQVFALPLFHIGGLLIALLAADAGATTILLPDGDPARIVKTIAEHRATHLLVVPALLTAVLETLNRPEHADIDLTSLEVVFYGAAPMPEILLRRALERFGGVSFMSAYGMTETAAGMTFMLPVDHDLSTPGAAGRLCAAGRAGAEAEVKIVDPETLAELERGQTGEILLRGPQTMRGYWQLAEATAEVLLPNGWYRTGDVGFLADDGYLFLTDRIKDMYISGGENVYPTEVENLLIELRAVREVAVIGVPDGRLGETGKAIIVIKPGAALTQDEVVAFCRSRMARYKCPTHIQFVDQLPRNAAGKVIKNVLREQHDASSAKVTV